MNTSPPVQVWAPKLGFSPFDSSDLRDIHRAQIQWRHEDRVWLLPDLKDPFRWVEQTGSKLRQLAIPAENLNFFDVVNVDGEGYSFPPLLLEGGRPIAVPSGLYRQWLDTEPGMVRCMRQLPLKVPVIRGETVSYVEAKIELEPGAVLQKERQSETNADDAMASARLCSAQATDQPRDRIVGSEPARLGAGARPDPALAITL